MYLFRKHHIPTYIVLILGSFIMLFPFAWMLLTSVKTMSESLLIPPVLFPQKCIWENYKEANVMVPFSALYINTLLLIFWRVLLATIFSSMAGFAFGKLEFPLKKFFFLIILAQMMLPSQIFIIPQYKMLAKLNMLNTVFALVFPGIVSAFGTFFLRQFYLSLPKDLMEAARLDGCNVWQTFIKVMFPLTKTAVMALAIFTAIFAYSDMMWPLIVNGDITKMTLSAGISSLQSNYLTNFPVLMAGSTLAMIPMLVLYLFFQKQFIEGIALTGTKG
ncbi:MAG: carbohydrate ABC transporter permease [Eubacteriales bacterium]|nr:carbohydrate ABC transporter permease [Eubacteriales bacterium]